MSGLDASVTQLGVVAGGGTGGQALVQLNRRFGTSPYEVTWTTISPDGGADDARLSADRCLPEAVSLAKVGCSARRRILTIRKLLMRTTSRIVRSSALGIQASTYGTGVKRNPRNWPSIRP